MNAMPRKIMADVMILPGQSLRGSTEKYKVGLASRKIRTSRGRISGNGVVNDIINGGDRAIRKHGFWSGAYIEQWLPFLFTRQKAASFWRNKESLVPLGETYQGLVPI